MHPIRGSDASDSFPEAVELRSTVPFDNWVVLPLVLWLVLLPPEQWSNENAPSNRQYAFSSHSERIGCIHSPDRMHPTLRR